MNRRAAVARVVERMTAQAREFPGAYLMAGDFYLELGESERAIAQYSMGMRADPKQETAYQKRMVNRAQGVGHLENSSGHPLGHGVVEVSAFIGVHQRPS